MKLTRKLAGALAFVMTSGVNAQINKCAVNGKVVYQQASCEGAKPVNISGAGAANPESTGAQQARREVDYYKRKQIVDGAVASGRVLIGMTESEVTRAWGTPSKVNRSATTAGTSEQWVYHSKRIGYDHYVYLENGLVRSLQGSE